MKIGNEYIHRDGCGLQRVTVVGVAWHQEKGFCYLADYGRGDYHIIFMDECCEWVLSSEWRDDL